MIIGYSPRIAVLYALLTKVVMAAFKKEMRLGPAKIIQAMADYGINTIMIANAAITAGIVIGVVLLTGMGTKITTLVVSLSAGSLLVALPIVMLGSLLFGMGLPTVVCYVLLAATVAPSLIDLGLPLLSAHLFIFYFGMLCMVTSPVSFASYAGAAIAKSDPIKTGWTAWTFILAGFVPPYMFVYNKALLLMGSPLHVSFSIVTSLIGVICLGGGIIGYLHKPARIYERVLLLSAALLLIKPGLLTDISGLLCAAVVVVLQIKRQPSPVTDLAA